MPRSLRGAPTHPARPDLPVQAGWLLALGITLDDTINYGVDINKLVALIEAGKI